MLAPAWAASMRVGEALATRERHSSYVGIQTKRESV